MAGVFAGGEEKTWSQWEVNHVKMEVEIESCCHKQRMPGTMRSWRGFPDGLVVKNLPANAGDTDSIPGSGRSPREWNGNPPQYSCLENPTDRGAWWATVHGVTRVGHSWATKPPPEAGRGKKGSSHRGPASTMILDFWPPVISHNKLMLFQPSSLWYFVTAA